MVEGIFCALNGIGKTTWHDETLIRMKIEIKYGITYENNCVSEIHVKMNMCKM